MNEVDTFGAKLNGILAADLTSVALAQGSLDTIPLGPLATLMPLLQMAGQLNDPTIKSALKQVGEGGGENLDKRGHVLLLLAWQGVHRQRAVGV